MKDAAPGSQLPPPFLYPSRFLQNCRFQNPRKDLFFWGGGWLLASDGQATLTRSTWVAGASVQQCTDFCTPAKIPESVFIERYRDTDRQHLPIDTKAAREPQRVFADGKLGSHTLHHAMGPFWESTLPYVVASLCSSFQKEKAGFKDNPQTQVHPSKAKGGTGGEGHFHIVHGNQKGWGWLGHVPFGKARQ